MVEPTKSWPRPQEPIIWKPVTGQSYVEKYYAYYPSTGNVCAFVTQSVEEGVWELDLLNGKWHKFVSRDAAMIWATNYLNVRNL